MTNSTIRAIQKSCTNIELQPADYSDWDNDKESGMLVSDIQ